MCQFSTDIFLIKGCLIYGFDDYFPTFSMTFSDTEGDNLRDDSPETFENRQEGFLSLLF